MLELWLRVRGLEFKGSVEKLPNETRRVPTEVSSSVGPPPTNSDHKK